MGLGECYTHSRLAPQRRRLSLGSTVFCKIVSKPVQPLPCREILSISYWATTNLLFAPERDTIFVFQSCLLYRHLLYVPYKICQWIWHKTCGSLTENCLPIAPHTCLRLVQIGQICLALLHFKALFVYDSYLCCYLLPHWKMFRFHILRWLLWCNYNSVQLLVYMHFTAHNIVLQCTYYGLTCHFVFMSYPFPPSTLSDKLQWLMCLRHTYQFQKLLRYPSIFYTQTRCWRRQGLSKSFGGHMGTTVTIAHKTKLFCLLLERVAPYPYSSF